MAELLEDLNYDINMLCFLPLSLCDSMYYICFGTFPYEMRKGEMFYDNGFLKIRKILDMPHM